MKTLLRLMGGLLLAAAPLVAQAQLSGDGFDYVINPDDTSTITITNYTGLSGIVAIPSTINTLTVTAIGNGAQPVFTSIDLTNVTIPDSVLTIEDYAFYGNFYLTNVAFGQNVTSLGESAFQFCFSLTNITLPDSVLTIGDSSFDECNHLTNCTIGSNVVTIDDNAFNECSDLQQITIPQSTTSFGQYVFYECIDLTNLTILGAPDIGENSFFGDEYMQNATIAGGTIEDYAFYSCSGLTNLSLGPGVTSIGQYAFSECGLSNVMIPATVTNLGDWAFASSTNLTNATVDCGYVGDYAFYECSNLVSITFGRDVATLGSEVFEYDSNLAGVYFLGDTPAASGTLFYGGTNGSTTVYYYTDTGGWESSYEGVPTLELAPSSLQVTLSPTAARTTGASWQLDNTGALETNSVTTLVDLTPGSHSISFTPIPGWVTPSNEVVTITNGKTATAVGIYMLSNAPAPADGLVLATNGYGVIHHGGWPSVLVDGRKYTVTAVANKNNVFVSWAGGINQPYAVLSASASYTFVMEPGLVLSANFETNTFLAAAGTYNGLFYTDTNGVTEDTAGMLKNLTLRDNGSYSGTILFAGGSHGISGSFNSIGNASNHIARAAAQGGPLQVQMSLDADDSPTEVLGVVYGTNGTGPNAVPWVANLTAYLATNDLAPAEYTLLMAPDTNNSPPASSPGGDGYTLITNNLKGTAKIVGALADGSALSQTAPVSQGSYLPIYVSLYGGKGLLLGWINLDTTNATNNSLTWLHPITTRGLYRGGFTNVLDASQILLTTWANPPVIDNLTNLSLVDTVNDTNVLTSISVTTSASGQISGSDVSGSINLKTGLLKVVIGSGSDAVKGYGAILLGTNGAATNSGGYFLTSTNAQGIELSP